MENSNIVSIEKQRNGRGGKRVGAGRKPGAKTANPGRFIYVIHEADDPTICKIGMANNPHTRLSVHQVSTWRKLRLAAVFTAGDAHQAYLIERSTQRRLSGLHESGEWFRVSPDRAVAEIREAAEDNGFAIMAFDSVRDMARNLK